jgi:DNA-binding beta-propeller fold protein YncE
LFGVKNRSRFCFGPPLERENHGVPRLISIACVAVFAILVPVTNSLALQITGLRNPAGFLVDAATDTYYLSNQNGGPNEHDNNGFISQLNVEGKILKLKFIEGGQNGVRLDAPKGLALVGRTLYVSDIDKVRAFELPSGRPVAGVDLSTFPVDFLTGLVTDGRGLLYIADSGADTIYKVDLRAGGRPVVWVKDKDLAGPHGLAVHPSTGALIVVSWNTGRILEISEAGAIRVLFSNSLFNAHFGNLMGVDFDAYGNLYVSDFSQGKIIRIDSRLRIQTIAEFLTTPAGLAIDRKHHVILVPYLMANVAEINGLGRDKR